MQIVHKNKSLVVRLIPCEFEIDEHSAHNVSTENRKDEARFASFYLIFFPTANVVQTVWSSYLWNPYGKSSSRLRWRNTTNTRCSSLGVFVMNCARLWIVPSPFSISIANSSWELSKKKKLLNLSNHLSVQISSCLIWSMIFSISYRWMTTSSNSLPSVLISSNSSRSVSSWSRFLLRRNESVSKFKRTMPYPHTLLLIQIGYVKSSSIFFPMH